MVAASPTGHLSRPTTHDPRPTIHDPRPTTHHPPPTTYHRPSTVRYSRHVPPAAVVRLRVAATAALLLIPAAAFAADEGLPRVHLIATGGTIANRPDARLTHQELVQSVPMLSKLARVDSEQFSNVTSDMLTPAEWLLLARRINDTFQRDASL